MLVNVKTVTTSILESSKSADDPKDIANIFNTFLSM